MGHPMESVLHGRGHMRFCTVAFAALILAAPALFAADFGLRAGQYRDAGQEFIGAEMLFDAGVLNINPNIEYNLDDEVTSGSANLDVTIDIGKFSSITPYLGAGIGLLYIDDESGIDETDLVGNVIGGIGLDLSFFNPYAQVKYRRLLEDDDGDSDEIAIAIGLRF
jgi:opacity protein-like surface antigen